MKDNNDKLAELEALILKYYLKQGKEIGVGDWGFDIRIYSKYKSKRLHVYFVEDGTNFCVLDITEKTTKDMFDEAYSDFINKMSI